MNEELRAVIVGLLAMLKGEFLDELAELIEAERNTFARRR